MQYNIDLLDNLKNAQEDFEFYPTTNEILDAVAKDINLLSEEKYFRFNSLLDIGAGNGKTLLRLGKEFGVNQLYAIEKSEILCQRLDPSIFIIGTDFMEQSLFDKTAQITFCNPPYAQFECWSEKIIRQSASNYVYLVIPERWNISERIADALKFRDADFTIIGTYDFLSSEDRKARAIVNLIRIELASRKDNAFNKFFDAEFGHLKEKFELKQEDKKPDNNQTKFDSLIIGESYPVALVNLYREEMAEVERNYRAIGDLNVTLLKALQVDLPKIRKCLKEKLESMKNTYWQELFKRLDSITNCLTSKSRQNILNTLNAHAHVDFTIGNIYAIVIWVIKNSNDYLESQLIDTYEKLVDKSNVYLYKSNQRTWIEDRWRYNSEEEKNSHYALEYRIVTHRIGGIEMRSYMGGGLEERGCEFLGDVLTIARNLGFNCITNPHILNRIGCREWEAGQRQEFHFNRNDKEGVLMEVKAFQNGNVHIRFNPEFMKCLNVEFGRLKGWLKNASEAAQELNDSTVAKYFASNKQFGLENSPYLLLK